MAIFKSNLLDFRIGMNTLGTLPFRFVFFCWQFSLDSPLVIAKPC